MNHLNPTLLKSRRPREIADYRNCAIRDGRIGELCSVRFGAWKRKEKIPRRPFASVVCPTVHFERQRRRRQRSRDRHTGKHIFDRDHALLLEIDPWMSLPHEQYADALTGSKWFSWSWPLHTG